MPRLQATWATRYPLVFQQQQTINRGSYSFVQAREQQRRDTRIAQSARTIAERHAHQQYAADSLFSARQQSAWRNQTTFDNSVTMQTGLADIDFWTANFQQ